MAMVDGREFRRKCEVFAIPKCAQGLIFLFPRVVGGVSIAPVKRVLFIQHGDVDKPGLLAEVLVGAGVELEVLHAHRGEPVPERLGGYDGLALGGGEQSAWEDEKYPYLAGECRLVHAAAEAGKPVIGLCLGGQLMARACGAEVRRAAQKEIGFFPVTLADGAAADPVLGHFPAKFPATHWHGDIFDLPAGAERLASSAMTANQAFRFGRGFYGFQFHPEMTPALFRELVDDARDFFDGSGMDADALVRESEAVLPPLEPCVRTAFRAWAEFL